MKIIEKVYWATRSILRKVILFNNLIFEEALNTLTGFTDDTYIAGIIPANNPCNDCKDEIGQEACQILMRINSERVS